MTADEHEPPKPPAEVVAAMKKAGLVWLSWGGYRPVPAWFATVDGRYVVLSDRGYGEEQGLPGLAEAGTVEVIVPTKPATTRLVRWTAEPRPLAPGSPEWEAAAVVLRSDRLNASDLDAQLERWRTGAELIVLEPLGPVSEQPGDYDDRPPAMTPTGSPASTRGRRPRVLHRRARRHPGLTS